MHRGIIRWILTMGIKYRFFLLLAILSVGSVLILLSLSWSNSDKKGRLPQYLVKTTRRSEHSVSAHKIFLQLPSSLRKFCNLLQQHEIQAILIEPCVLWKILTVSQQQDLIFRKITSGQNCRKNGSVYTLAVAPQENTSLAQQQHLFKMFSKDAQDQSFVVKTDFGGNSMSHLIAEENGTMIHLVIMEKRSSFLMVKPFSKKEVSGDLSFGQRHQAFDHMDTMYISSDEVIIRVPKNIPYFLMEEKYSEFVECDKKLAKSVHEQRARKEELDDKINHKLDQSLQLLRELQKLWTIPLWLDGGTLLGWNRECGSLPFDHDVDVTTFLSYMNNSWAMIEKATEESKMPWALEEIFGFPWEALQLRFWNFKMRWGLDIFFADWDPERNEWICGYHPAAFKSYCKLNYPKEAFSKICSAEFNGQKVFVPCDASMIHSNEYGEDWKTPSKEFHINNGWCSDYWQPDESAHAYQCLGLNKNLLVVNRTKIYSHEERTVLNLTDNFLDLGYIYFKTCQYIKVSGWVVV